MIPREGKIGKKNFGWSPLSVRRFGSGLHGGAYRTESAEEQFVFAVSGKMRTDALIQRGKNFFGEDARACRTYADATHAGEACVPVKSGRILRWNRADRAGLCAGAAADAAGAASAFGGAISLPR